MMQSLLLLSCLLSLGANACGIHGHSHAGEDHGAHGDAADVATAVRHPTTAIVLTTISGMSAVLGGLVVVIVGVPSKVVLGHLLSFAAGVMLYVSYADMLPEAMKTTGWQAGFWFFAGAVGFMGLSTMLPELEVSDFIQETKMSEGNSHGRRARVGPAVAQLANNDEGGIDLEINGKQSDGESPSKDGSGQIRQRRPRSGSRSTGRRAPKSEDTRIAENVEGSNDAKSDVLAANIGGMTLAERRRAMVTGLLAAVGVALHNLPEGLIVYTQAIPGICSQGADGGVGDGAPAEIGWGEVFLEGGMHRVLQQCMSRGVAITLAIALHNIPEGMAVASPILASTGSAWEAMKWTVITSIFEPAAAILFGWAFEAQLSPWVAANISAAVAGIMVVLCVQELVPSAAENVNNARAVALSNLAGQGLMWASLTFLVA